MRLIAAVTVNHNTSLYTELMLRSLFATHDRHAPTERLDLSLTVMDNASEDGIDALHAYADSVGVPVVQSGFTIGTKHNSHGEVLRRFVLDRPEATHYLFLDTDTVFSQSNTIRTMADELDDAPDDVFAIGARMGYPWTPTEEVKPEQFATVYERRLHPFCALFRNTPLLRAVAEHVGFHCYRSLLPDGDRYLDTNELLCLVMRAFGKRYARSSTLVGHFFAVSYDTYGEGYARHRAGHRDGLLTRLRALDTSTSPRARREQPDPARKEVS